MAATRPIATPSRKRSAPVDDTASETPVALTTNAVQPRTAEHRPKRQRQVRPEIRTEAMMREQAGHSGKPRDQAAVQSNVAIKGEEDQSDIDSDDGIPGGVKLEMR